MQKMQGLLARDGLFLNHAIARRAPKESFFKRRLRPEQRAIAKYIFPGGELDDIGHSLVAMERAGFEVQDVEAWRLHYARTCKLWCERLTAEREKAIQYVGEEKYRIWVAYLAGVSLAFSRGTLQDLPDARLEVGKAAPRDPADPRRSLSVGPRQRRYPLTSSSSRAATRASPGANMRGRRTSTAPVDGRLRPRRDG